MEFPPRKRRAQLPASMTKAKVPYVDDSDQSETSQLPGSNVYDPAVASGRIDYQTAKTREEVALVAEKLEQAKINTEQSRIDLDKHKLDLQLARGAVITKEEYIVRQDSLINAFLELLRLTVNEACLPLPGSIRPDHSAKMTGLTSSAMGAIADCVMRREGPEQINAALLRVFTGDEM